MKIPKEQQHKSEIFKKLKKINPDDLELYSEEFWQLSYKEAVELTYIYIKELINRDPTAENIKSRWHELNKKNRIIYLSKTRINIIRTTTATGKTVTTIMWAKFMTKLYPKIDGFVVLSAEYEYGTDEIKRIILKHGNQIDFIEFKGIPKLCINFEMQVNDNRTTIRDLYRLGISIKPFCKDECEDENTCKYRYNCSIIQKTVEEGGIKNWIGVQHQLRAFFPIYLNYVSNIILILDEDFSDAIKIHNTYKLPVLRSNLNFLEKVLTELNPKTKFYKFIVKTKILINMFITSYQKYIVKEITELDYTAFINIIDEIIELKGKNDDYIIKLNEFAYDYISFKIMSPFKFIFSEINNFIDNYNDLKKSNIAEIEKWIKAVFYITKMKYTFLYYDKQLLKYLLKEDRIKKLIITDATADKLKIESLIANIEPIEDYYEDWDNENCEVHHLRKPIQRNRQGRKYAYYGKTSYFLYDSSKATFNYNMNHLKLILELHDDEPVLVGLRDISGKKLKHITGGIKLSDFIQSLGHPDVRIAEYPVKGTNVFSDVNVVVVFMNADLDKVSIKRQSTLLNKEIKEYGKNFSVNLITQLGGRIERGNDYKYFYILTGIDIPKYRKRKGYHTYKSHTELNNYLKQQIKKKEEKKKENTLLKHIKENKFITIKEYAEIYNVSDVTAGKILNKLEKEGVIKFRRIERGKKQFYI